MDDTIAAISTPKGEGAIAVVRISGFAAFDIAKKIFTTSKNSPFPIIKNHKILYGYVDDPDSRERVDEVILLAMPAPRTYTCEDIVEINCHGGNFLVNKVLSLALKMGARLAEPGEFTKRAFLNGRIDLVRAEAVADLIKADSDAALHAASSLLQGTLSLTIKSINDLLIEVAASVEASIDFPEEDIDTASYNAITAKIKLAIENIDDLIKTFFKGRVFREGAGIVITGRPNVGKSSLLNALLMENRVIVTPYPGTTRDIIEESIIIDGIKFKIKDTAGLRKEAEEVELEGIKRAKNAAHDADIVIFVVDSGVKLTDKDIDSFNQIKNKNIIVVANKTDLPRKLDVEKGKKLFNTGEIIKISAKENTGLDELKKKLKANIVTDSSSESNAGHAVITRFRHQQLLVNAKKNLIAALKSLSDKTSEEFIAIDLNSALNCIEEITGRKVSEDILDKIFREFCIGK